MSKCRIFVYGTLRRGFGNNVLIRHQTFIGEAITEERNFALIDSFGLPFVVRTDKKSKLGYRIAGEVWEIDQRTLAAVDHLEANGSLYQREKIRTSVGRAWMYLGITDKKGFLGLIKPSPETVAPADEHGVQLWDPANTRYLGDDFYLSEEEEKEEIPFGEEREILFLPETEEDPEDRAEAREQAVLEYQSSLWTGAPY